MNNSNRIFICDLTRGGHHFSFSLSLIDALLKNNYQVISCTKFNDELKEHYGEREKVHFIPLRKSFIYQVVDKIFTKKFAQLKNWLLLRKALQGCRISSCEPGCIILADGNNFFPATIYNQKIFKKLTRIPTIAIPHFFDYCRPQSPPELNKSLESTGLSNVPFIKGCLLLDYELYSFSKEIKTNINFGFLPIYTKVRENPEHGQVSRELKDFAKNRKIILLCGVLSPRKGVIKFLNLAQEKEFKNCVFAAIGSLNTIDYSYEENLFIEKARALSNVFIYDKKIESDEEFTKIVSDADIVYSVYEKFERSSGIIPLAAYYKIPVISSAVHCVGQIMRFYDIGEGANPSDYMEIRNKLRLMLDKERHNYDFSTFNKDYSESVYESNLCSMIDRIIK